MNLELRIKFGYPVGCANCNNFEEKPRHLDKIDPYYQSGDKIRLMLIGQDPTIFDDPDRVSTVLMLNETSGRNAQLRRWLERELFGADNFGKIELYATNLVKCQFPSPPSKNQVGALKFLKPRFEYCKIHLFKEVERYKPELVLTLGESAHKLFSNELEVLEGDLEHTMKGDFTGKFIKVKLGKTYFEYSPCLHIKTFRVAVTYGKQIFEFKSGLLNRLK